VIDTISPKVQLVNRRPTDVLWGVLFLFAYAVFLGCGIWIVDNAHPKYNYIPTVYNSTSDAMYDRRVISDYYRKDLEKCCVGDIQSGLCYMLEDEFTRRLEEEPDKVYGLEVGEGIFDAFLKAPEVITVMFGGTVCVALLWLLLLRYFAKPVIYGTEIFKAILCFTFAVYSALKNHSAYQFLFAAGLITLVLVYVFRSRFEFAATIISHSVTAMKGNNEMLFGAILSKLLYVAQSFIFVYFFSKSFEVVEITKAEYYNGCEFVWPQYSSGIAVYFCLLHLWTTLFLDKLRLSIIASHVGAWHFHQDEKPSILHVLSNSTTKSFGTLSLGALISTIADQVNRTLNDPLGFWDFLCCCSCALKFFLRVVVCACGTFLSTAIKILTKFAIIVHVFSGLSFYQSGKKCASIMSRHFKNGFVVEYCSRSVIGLGALCFSVAVFFLTWIWFDETFNTKMGPTGGLELIYWVGWMVFCIFAMWYPSLFIYGIILINRYFFEDSSSIESVRFVPIFAAMFIACISMSFFTFVGNIILDVIDVIFVCYAIDKDNNIDVVAADESMIKWVESVPGYIPVSMTDPSAPAVLEEGGVRSTSK